MYKGQDSSIKTGDTEFSDMKFWKGTAHAINKFDVKEIIWYIMKEAETVVWLDISNRKMMKLNFSGIKHFSYVKSDLRKPR